MNAKLFETAKALPLDERIELAGALWDSIVQEGYEPGLTPAQASELDRRVADHQANPEDVVAWDKVKADLDSKYGPNK